MEKPKRKSLGRGLDALLGEQDFKFDDFGPNSREPDANRIVFVDIGSLVPGEFQPRREFDNEELLGLAESIRSNGIIHPILVRTKSKTESTWEIVAGERRWRAAQMAQQHQVPIIAKDLTDEQTLEIALVENLQRQDLSVLEEAAAYNRLIEEFSYSHKELGKFLGKSRSHVANSIRLLGLPEKVKGLIQSKALTAGHGRALLAANSPEKLAKLIVSRGLNVRQTERMVGGETKFGSPHGQKLQKDRDTLNLENELSAAIGLKVTIQASNYAGKLTIFYKNVEQLETVVSKLRKS